MYLKILCFIRGVPLENKSHIPLALRDNIYASVTLATGEI